VLAVKRLKGKRKMLSKSGFPIETFGNDRIGYLKGNDGKQ